MQVNNLNTAQKDKEKEPQNQVSPISVSLVPGDEHHLLTTEDKYVVKYTAPVVEKHLECNVNHLNCCLNKFTPDCDFLFTS